MWIKLVNDEGIVVYVIIYKTRPYFTDNFSLILGLAIGIPVFFVLAFIIALVCILMRKNKKSKRLREEDDW